MMGYSNYEEYREEYEPDWEEEEEWKKYRRDPKIDEAKETLREFFKSERKGVFHVRQLQVRHEKKFFHWITARAVNELLDEKLVRSEKVTLQGATRVKFIFHRGHRFYKRQVTKSLELIRRYSDLGRACGSQAETLFLNGLALKGFVPKGRKVNEYGGRKWEKTGHDLDFIVERDSIPCGCEVKNKLEYIDREELKVKLEMCDFLGIKPVFIMRWSPKSYNWDIIQQGGYAMIFEMQIYPFGCEKLVKEIRAVLGMPVDCPSAIPEGIMKRFDNWHRKQRNV